MNFQEIPGSKKAMNWRFNTTLTVVETLMDLLVAHGFKVGDAKLNPYGYGQANQLIPVKQIEDLPRNESLAYQIEVNGVNVQAALVWRNVQFLGEATAFEMLSDELKYQG